MDAKHFGERLKELRTDAGLSREDLAEAAGLAVAGLANLEQDRTKPKWETAVALAAALGVSLDEFTRPPGRVMKQGRGRPHRSK